MDAPDPDRLEATTVRIEDLSVAPRGALTRQGDEGQVATSAPGRPTGPDVLETSRDHDVMNTPLGNRGKAIHKAIFVDILESHAIMHGNINLDTLGDNIGCSRSTAERVGS